ncbi:hypothetical protein BDP27DRAFT_1484385 [Rhodocollybia butyracea]|uniref:Uncharacterized protein n=1 Tax=Rhodocollybia butyracea TaxID=206335 RepID=A0A9P5U1Y0_9AGAR|nr:hypothetical protein BDP27DRAFT_1484385 [Rhodocollybia butyracea]
MWSEQKRVVSYKNAKKFKTEFKSLRSELKREQWISQKQKEHKANREWFRSTLSNNNKELDVLRTKRMEEPPPMPTGSSLDLTQLDGVKKQGLWSFDNEESYKSNQSKDQKSNKYEHRFEIPVLVQTYAFSRACGVNCSNIFVGQS